MRPSGMRGSRVAFVPRQQSPCRQWENVCDQPRTRARTATYRAPTQRYHDAQAMQEEEDAVHGYAPQRSQRGYAICPPVMRLKGAYSSAARARRTRARLPPPASRREGACRSAARPRAPPRSPPGKDRMPRAARRLMEGTAPRERRYAHRRETGRRTRGLFRRTPRHARFSICSFSAAPRSRQRPRQRC